MTSTVAETAASFPLEAIGSTITSVVAIGAALFVGTKQIAISKALAKLQEDSSTSDLLLKRQALQLDLLERRSNCISRFRSLWGSWSAQGHLTLEEINELRRVLWDAELLFPGEIADDLETVFHSSASRAHFEARHQQALERGSQKADEYLSRVFAEEDKANDKMPSLLTRMVSATKIIDDGEA